MKSHSYLCPQPDSVKTFIGIMCNLPEFLYSNTNKYCFPTLLHRRLHSKHMILNLALFSFKKYFGELSHSLLQPSTYFNYHQHQWEPFFSSSLSTLTLTLLQHHLRAIARALFHKLTSECHFSSQISPMNSNLF